MGAKGAQKPADAHPLFVIGSIAKMLRVHPQTLRLYERHGFITPARTNGNTRLYSWQDVEQLRAILYLTRNLGVNLAGVDIIVNMQRKIATLQGDIDALRHGIAEHIRGEYADTNQQRALIKADSRTLVKVQRNDQEHT